MLLLVFSAACRDASRIDASVLSRNGGEPALRVTVLGAPNDPRLPVVREAVVHWNDELQRLGRRVRLVLDTVPGDSVPDSVLRAASGEATRGRGAAIDRLSALLRPVSADIVVALSHTDLVSFGLPWDPDAQGVVAIRRADVPPLTLPNTLRNVVAHELGHALGLTHNISASTLMCGRPAPCRPAAFASDSAHFFPLTSADEAWLRARWP